MTKYGPGDAQTWPPCANHAHDPRTPDTPMDEEELEIVGKYTVVLLRPDYIAEPYGQDTYTASVIAISPKQAIKAAQAEVYKADIGDDKVIGASEDYQVLLVFDGHPNIALFGFMYNE